MQTHKTALLLTRTRRRGSLSSPQRPTGKKACRRYTTCTLCQLTWIRFRVSCRSTNRAAGPNGRYHQEDPNENPSHRSCTAGRRLHGAFTCGARPPAEEAWVRLDGISGTSAGAMNAAVLACTRCGRPEAYAKRWRTFGACSEAARQPLPPRLDGDDDRTCRSRTRLPRRDRDGHPPGRPTTSIRKA
jgi:hypothetical protein